MAGWLSRASSLFQQPPPPPEPFEVECDCGGKAKGHRSSVYQKPACPVCERPIFVLPANVYPTQKPKPKPKPKNKAPKVVEDAKSTGRKSNVVIDDEPNPTQTPSRPSSKSTVERIGTPETTVESAILREPSKPLLTPLRLITAAIVVMSALTIGGLWRRHRIENAKVIVSKAADAGMAAIRERDFPLAARELDRARSAVEILGRNDQAAVEIRRYSREATALANLDSSTLTECLEETLGSGKPGQSENARMSSVHKGAWVVFDADIRPASDGKGNYTVDIPMQLKVGTVRVEIASPIFQRIAQPTDSGDASRAIFAAQLEQIAWRKDASSVAVLILNGKSAFLWTNYDTYAGIGYIPSDSEGEKETRSVLERQIDNQQKQ